MCASCEVRSPEVLSLLSDPPFEVVIQVLDRLIAHADKFREKINIKDKVLAIYKYLCLFQQQNSCLKEITISLNKKPWIWHPNFRMFYAANQVVLSPDLLRTEDNEYLISFPYRDDLSDKNFETFLIRVGLVHKINYDNIIVCFERIYADFGAIPLNSDLINFVLILIESISCCERF